MKLYVDVDETLVFWPNPNLPHVGNYRVNDDLVSVLKEGIKSGDYDVTIWSAGGSSWAEEINSTLFFGCNLPSSGKHQLYQHIPANSYAVDDRLIHDRFYLYKFEKVFLPEEFVEYAKDRENFLSGV